MYKKKNEPVYFGSLRTICHEKNAEMQKVIKEYKGRVVFRGDTVKTEDGYLAVFSEQGTASSHMAATKFLDAMGRMPDCEGEDSDAVGAYTQVSLDKETLKLLVGEGVFVDTWVALPRNRWPKDANGKVLWDDIDTPYVPLKRNLYGHKLAGLLWQKY